VFLNDEPLHCSDPDYDDVLEETALIQRKGTWKLIAP
jgi:hypothetical protein